VQSVHGSQAMQLAYFHTNTILSSWTIWGAATVLRRMGHDVLDAPIPTNAFGQVIRNMSSDEFNGYARHLPTLDDLRACDRIIVMGPEYIAPWLVTLYGENWRTLASPRVGIFLESTARSDVKLPIESLKANYNICYFPDPSDARRLGGYWPRPSVDTAVFCPDDHTPKRYGAAFVGTLYPKRTEFLNRLAPHLDGPFVVGDVHAHDIGGECQELWTQLYVRSLRQIQVHVALPSNNPMPVSRPFETLACGTFLIESSRLPEPLEDRVHYRLYDAADPTNLAELIRYYLVHERERQAMAREGCALVRREFAAERMWQEVLAQS
jgi:glycosyltransferase involved in cell wall biosynthesis